MGVTLTARYCGSDDAERRVSDLDHVLRCKYLPETRPPGARIELCLRAEERGIAAHTSEEPCGVEIPGIPGVGPLRASLPGDLIRDCGKLTLPLRSPGKLARSGPT